MRDINTSENYMKAEEFQKIINRLAKEDGFDKFYFHFGNAWEAEVGWTTHPTIMINNHDQYIRHKYPLPYVGAGCYNEMSHVSWDYSIPLYEGYCGGDKKINKAIDEAYMSDTAPKEQTPESFWEWLKPFLNA